jgi:hypothetical protein
LEPRLPRSASGGRARFCALDARSEINPKASIEPPGASKDRSIAFRKFQPLSQNPELSMAYARTAAKKFRPRPWGGHGSLAAEANGPTRALAHPVNCVSRLRGLSSSIQILAFPRLIYLEGAPQLPCERPAQPTQRPLTAREHIMNDAYSAVKKNVEFF